jgi:hypothetical protein
MFLLFYLDLFLKATQVSVILNHPLFWFHFLKARMKSSRDKTEEHEIYVYLQPNLSYVYIAALPDTYFQDITKNSLPFLSLTSFY